MTEACSWQDKRGNDCARPAVWIVTGDPYGPECDSYAYSCNVHLADIVRERAVEWVDCWVDKA